MQQMPLSRRVIFSDWHGVLSRDPFWVSIRNSATHPLHDQLEAGMAALFRSEVAANEWMKGLLSSAEVIQEMGIQLHGRFRDDFLARRLDLDCARMKVNVDLFEVLRIMRTDAVVVIATDNMDCFVRAFENARTRPRKPRLPVGGTLADWAKICDDIICSSQNGALKSENPTHQPHLQCRLSLKEASPARRPPSAARNRIFVRFGHQTSPFVTCAGVNRNGKTPP
jgi:hypothetical protein